MHEATLQVCCFLDTGQPLGVCRPAEPTFILFQVTVLLFLSYLSDVRLSKGKRFSPQYTLKGLFSYDSYSITVGWQQLFIPPNGLVTQIQYTID